METHARLLQQHFPALYDPEDTGLDSLQRLLRHLTLSSGQPVFQPGAACSDYLLVIAGSVRVTMITESGREVILYRVGPGQSCILTTSCMLAHEHYPAAGRTETAVEALALGRAHFEQVLEASPAFRRFVFTNLGRRLAEVIQRMEAVAFQSVDRRLTRFLLDGADPDGRLKRTHQEIALELGCAREAVSRHLKRLEEQGLLRLQRSCIELTDRAGLESVERESV